MIGSYKRKSGDEGAVCIECIIPSNEAPSSSCATMRSVPTFRLNEKDKIKDAYRKYQIVLIKRAVPNPNFSANTLHDFYRKSVSSERIIETTFTTENDSNSGHKYTADNVFGTKDALPAPNQGWYCSTIVQKLDKGEVGADEVAHFILSLPIADLSCLKLDNCTVTAPTWVFLGRSGKKYLKGRPEHTDSVSHDGTWHLQSKGSKVWTVRPVESAEWRNLPLGQAPVITPSASSDRMNKEHLIDTSDSHPRLSIKCEEGDLLIVNTRAWWHQTTLPPSGSRGVSLSYARDFYCPYLSSSDSSASTSTQNVKRSRPSKEDINKRGEGEGESEFTNVDGVYAARFVKAGDIVLHESELPDCSLPRCFSPNCEVVELEDETMALVALQDIQPGQFLSVADSDEEESDDDEEEDDEEDNDDDDEEEEEQ